MEYPPDQRLTYAELEAQVRGELASVAQPTVLVAESFSGPIAISIASDPPDSLIGLVLVATFATPPRSPWLRLLVGRHLFWLPPPSAIVRGFLLDARASDEDVREVVAAVRLTAPRVLAHRARCTLSADVGEMLQRIEIPILCIEASRDRLLVEPRALSRHRPDLRWHTVDAPHLVLKSNPREAAAAVAGFMARSASS